VREDRHSGSTRIKRLFCQSTNPDSTFASLASSEAYFYRELGQSQYRLAMVENISKSGILFECQPRLPEGKTVEMILEMPQEICGQANKHVICRGEVVRTATSAAATFMVGVAISGYSFLPQKVNQM